MNFEFTEENMVVLGDILKEYRRQISLRDAGKFKYTCESYALSSAEKYLVLGEEVGEVGTAILNARGLATDTKVHNVRSELIQVAAVVFAWIKGLDASTTSNLRGPTPTPVMSNYDLQVLEKVKAS